MELVKRDSQDTLKIEFMGTIKIRLFNDVVPITARNFRNLAIGHGVDMNTARSIG